ncbi:MAG: hypothetical protein BWY76_02543 [bacterium ADurb.Bin429]|nr:MAG: hypothetical protein BWY76_02543 [bacterium ADurb.Bin429]
MKLRAWHIMLVVLALGGIWFWMIYPALEQNARQAPMTDALAAAQRGDVYGVRVAFTDDARVQAGETRLPIGMALEVARPLIESRARGARLRFDGYRDPVVRGNTLEAEFYVWVYVERPDAPNRWVPLHKSGHVVLEKTGFLRWKIKELRSDDADFGDVLHGDEPVGRE